MMFLRRATIQSVDRSITRHVLAGIKCDASIVSATTTATVAGAAAAAPRVATAALPLPLFLFSSSATAPTPQRSFFLFGDPVPSISVEQFLQKPDAFDIILDVREQEEFLDGVLPNKTHLPLGMVGRMSQKEMDELWKGKKLLVYCRSGGRSSQAVSHLRKHGVDATNLSGGIRAWNAAHQ